MATTKPGSYSTTWSSMHDAVGGGVPRNEVWTPAVPVDDLWEGEVIGLRLAETDVLLVHLAGQLIRAYENRCPHAGAKLSEGRPRLPVLRCPSHGWEFDLRTGAGINPRNCSLKSYPVKVVDGWVMVRVEG